MSEIIVFPLVLRPPSEKKRRGRKASSDPAAMIEVFPFGRRQGLLERHTRAMRALAPEQAESYLSAVVDKLCAELNAIGLDCEELQCAPVIEFLDALGKRLHGPDFQLEEAAV